MDTKKTSMVFDLETFDLIELIARHRGGNRTTVIKQAVRELARKEGLLEEIPKKALKELRQA